MLKCANQQNCSVLCISFMQIGAVLAVGAAVVVVVVVVVYSRAPRSSGGSGSFQ